VLANAATQRRPDEMTAYTPERLALDGPGERRVL
jgi:hypothetical protein